MFGKRKENKQLLKKESEKNAAGKDSAGKDSAGKLTAEKNASEKRAAEKQPAEISDGKKRRAIKMSGHLEKHYSEKKVDEIEKKKDRFVSKKGLKEIWDKIEFLWKKLREKETPLKVKLAIFGGFAYMLLPVDIIPDYVPGLGFLDDATVFLYIWKTVVPYFTSTVVEIMEEAAAEKIKVILKDTYKNTIIRSAVILLINIAATLISCFRPFGETASKYTASFMFAACLCYSIYRTIRWAVKYGAMTVKIAARIIKNKSVRKGIADYVRSDDRKIFRQVSRAFQIADIAKQMSDIDLPSLEDVIHNYVKRFFKTLLLFFSLYMLYIILIYWILKPYILVHYAGLSTFQLIIYPVTSLILNLRK